MSVLGREDKDGEGTSGRFLQIEVEQLLHAVSRVNTLRPNTRI